MAVSILVGYSLIFAIIFFKFVDLFFIYSTSTMIVNYWRASVRMEQMPGQDSTTDFAKKRGKQKRLSLDEYAASLLQWLPSGIAASRAFQKTALAAVGFEPTPPKRLEP